ncbi:unnamed protein product, partial [Owenia fusiformis]
FKFGRSRSPRFTTRSRPRPLSCQKGIPSNVERTWRLEFSKRGARSSDILSYGYMIRDAAIDHSSLAKVGLNLVIIPQKRRCCIITPGAVQGWMDFPVVLLCWRS